MNKKDIIILFAKYSKEIHLFTSTLSWVCKSSGVIFDNYFHSYHSGIHYPGGDHRELDIGHLTGGTFVGDRHFEELNFITNHLNVSAIIMGETIFESTIKNHEFGLIANTSKIDKLYHKIFNHFEMPIPSTIVMVGSGDKKKLHGIEAYVYPEIIYRKAIAVPECISEDELKSLCNEETVIMGIFLNEKKVKELTEKGYKVEIIEELNDDDDYLDVTYRLAKRWYGNAEGWIIGDPTLVSHWIPTACDENLLSVYSTPQEKIIKKLGDMLTSKGDFVYGRQYNDRDFFELSKIQKPLQVIDPCRPPFQSVKKIDYDWKSEDHKDGFYGPEYSDNELRQFARDGRVLVSLMFWSGMIRELTNLYSLMDLIAITRLKCGLVLTSQSFEYMMHSPLELITLPLKSGGVYPCVEPILGSCGIGVGIESFIEPNRIESSIQDALKRILEKVKDEKYVPRGWWATMDTDLKPLSFRKKPKPIKFLKYPPYFLIRFHDKALNQNGNTNSNRSGTLNNNINKITDQIKQRIKQSGLFKYFESYRPYEFYESSDIKQNTAIAVKKSGLQYMFTKSGFNKRSKVEYIDDKFIAMNYTCGQWDGWTPFETVNNVTDLIGAEKKLFKSKKPGWIVSTIDSCLWTFSGEIWNRATDLFKIAQFCAEGGKSGQLINAKPYTISRYARIIEELKTTK